MKKVLSIALALVMMLAVCVPAFAANPITQDTENTGTAVVKTDTLKDTDGDGKGDTSAESFIVTIPADTVIPWGTEETALVYTVESHLAYGKHLEVSVAGNNVMKLAEDEAETLAYTLGGTTAFAADGPVVNPAADQDLTVTITADDWANAIVGEYADTLTFTAEVK